MSERTQPAGSMADEPTGELWYLRGVNRQLLGVLDSLADNVILHDAEGRLAWMNRRTRETAVAMGRDPDAFIGKPANELPNASWVTSAIDEVRARGAATREILITFPDGARWREDKATAIRGAEGIEGFVFVSRDIHDRKLTEARVRAVACVSALPRNPDPVPLLDALATSLIPDLADWAITVRDLADPGLGDVAASLAGGHATLVQDPRGARFERDGVRSLVAVPLAGELAGALLLGMTARSNRRFTADDLAVTEGLIERVRQVAENARLTLALAKSEARFRVALGTSNIAVFEQRRGQGQDQPPSWIHNPHFGRLADEPDARRGDDFSFLLRAPEYATLVADVLASGARLQQEIGFLASGEPRHVQVSLEPTLSAGEVVGVTGAAVDVTDARRAQDELAQALVFRERVLSVLGHDLGNPLAAVRGLAALLLRPPGLDADSREIVEQIDLAARRMHEMIDTLIDFSRARFKGGILIRRRPADLGAVAANVIRELEAARPGRTIQLVIDGDTRGEWDAARLAQALSNLIGNALTHGAHDRPVRVEIGDADGAIIIRVRNEGEPIPPEVRATIFEPFRRGQGKEEAHVPGLGLGLYIVREIAQAHGGDVTVESTREATTFTMRLPRSP